MATMITSDCINCGACEPECPNNAISQGEEIYVIDPQLCTECVGFHDYEACAAVCPVDCCVTDPNNVESEETLIARARALHPEVEFGDGFESRFRKGEKKEAPAPAAEPAQKQPASAEPQAQAAQEKEKPKPAAPAPAPKPAPAPVQAEKQPAVPAPTPKPAPTPPPVQAEKKPAAPPPPAPKAPRPEKHFPGEVAESFQGILQSLARRGPLAKPGPRILIFLLQPLLGALPQRPKEELEKAVGAPAAFSVGGATALNMLFNLALYPFIFIVGAAALKGIDILFSQQINLYILTGLFLGFAEGAYRLREAIFKVKPAEEVAVSPAFYGILLSYGLGSLIAGKAGLIRNLPIPVDGFYERGFVEKLERERRYGNVYTVEDWGDAYLLRVEFPRKLPDIGLPARSELPNEMPDYDYDLLLKDGHFIVKGRCIDEKVRKLSSSMGAFPPEFTTVIPLKEKVEGFSHRFDNKLLEVVLLKEKKRHGQASSHF